jgi:hypothetical protein
MQDRPHYLFEGSSALDLSRRIQDKAMSDLKGYDDNAMLSRSEDDLVAELLVANNLEFPNMRDSETWVEETELTREVRPLGYDVYSDGMGSYVRKFHTIIFHIPFTGDGNLFSVAPSSRSIPGPAAVVGRQELLFSIETAHKTEEIIRREYEARVQSINKHINTVKNDLRNISKEIELPARAYIQQRKAELLRSKNLVASLGFPLKRRAESPSTYIAPAIRRKLTPVKPKTDTPFKPEPTLDEAEYQHILTVMDNMTKVMERSPHTFQTMGEEDIRQHFLVQLNGQYEGQATGETFNVQGKTDILIRYQGANIFIAECKFWHGEKLFLETVDQLMSYLSWRDTKTAILIFNRNKNLSGVLAAIKDAMGKYAHVKRGPKVEGDTRLRYILGIPGDHEREIITTVLVYDIPRDGL